MRVLGRGIAAVFGALLLAGTFSAPALAQSAPTITLVARPASLPHNGSVTLAGVVTDPPAGATVQLSEVPYPYSSSHVIATVPVAVDGTYSYAARVDRDTHFAATISATTITASAAVEVGGRTTTKVKALTLGRAQVTMLIYHPRDLHWGHVKVHWWFATGWHGRYRRAPATRAKRLSRYVMRITTVITLPAGHFRWRVCFHAHGDHALENPRRWRGCTGRGYFGGGYLPVGYPTPADVARAIHYLQSRGGHTALAVIDTEGRLSGFNLHTQFITGSVVKAMLLVAYLRRLDSRGQHYVDSYSNSFLYPMIHVSDNNAATQTWSIVGNSGLDSVAHAAGMTEFATNSPYGSEWGAALISAADQAKFFFKMDSLIPHEFVGYARYLLSTIADYETWGIPTVARPLGYTVFFKAGWRPSPDVYLVHQIARLEGRHRTFAMAVMTDGDPDMGYGIASIEGTARSLLG